MNLKLIVLGVIVLALAVGAAYKLNTSGGLEYKGGYALALPMGGGAFLTIHNGYNRQVCLIKAEMPDNPNAVIQLHTTIIDKNGVMKMQPVDKICVGPGEDLKLEHGGYHIMIMNTKLNPGTKIKLTLYFDNGEKIVVELPVKEK